MVIGSGLTAPPQLFNKSSSNGHSKDGSLSSKHDIRQLNGFDDMNSNKPSSSKDNLHTRMGSSESYQTNKLHISHLSLSQSKNIDSQETDPEDTTKKKKTSMSNESVI